MESDINALIMDVYLGLGTNIGNKRRNLLEAVALLSERAGDITALSSFYETEPWGFESANLFLNAVLLLHTDLSPDMLLLLTQSIEKELGRTEKSESVYQDRIIDIDILLYGNEIIHSRGLVIPHPLMQERRFVLEPLFEIAPKLKHPLLGKSVEEMYKELISKGYNYGQK